MILQFQRQDLIDTLKRAAEAHRKEARYLNERLERYKSATGFTEENRDKFDLGVKITADKFEIDRERQLSMAERCEFIIEHLPDDEKQLIELAELDKL